MSRCLQAFEVSTEPLDCVGLVALGFWRLPLFHCGAVFRVALCFLVLCCLASCSFGNVCVWRCVCLALCFFGVSFHWRCVGFAFGLACFVASCFWTSCVVASCGWASCVLASYVTCCFVSSSSCLKFTDCEQK